MGVKTIVVLASVFLLAFGKPAEVDYREVFGNDYRWAESWVNRHDSLFTRYSLRYDIPAAELKAIVFPELVRYNRVFDALEIESLKYLYVSEGKEYADFSVGFFQMKPSFAESIEVAAGKAFGFGKLVDDEMSRRDRVRRLTSVAQQLNYLCAFYAVCREKFSQENGAAAPDRVRFFATAYNAGYHLSVARLKDLQGRKHFNGFNYADISVFYFKQIQRAG